MSFALLSDAPVTSSQIAANPVADGANLYIPSLDYSDPATGNNNITTAKIHMMKSANAGITWAEQNAAAAPQVYDTVSTGCGSPPTPPYFIIETEVFFDFPVPNIDWPPFQNIPWELGPGEGTPPPGYQFGNDTLEINLLEYGTVVLSCSLTVDGIFGTAFQPASIGIQLAAALNAQLIGLSISPSDLYFATGPAAIPWNHVGFNESINDGTIVLATSFTGNQWEISITGNMVSNLSPPSTFASVLTFYGAVTPIVIWTAQGIDPNLNPIPICFNTFSPPAIQNHVIYIAFIGLDQTVNIARYNTLTDAWMTTINGGPPVSMIVYDSELGASVNLAFYGSIKIRSNGDIVLAYNVGFMEGSNTYDAYWSVYSGGSWGSATSLGTVAAGVQFATPVGSAIDASDNVAFIINMEGGNSGGNPFVSTFCVKHDNTTVALANVDASPAGYSSIPLSQGNLFAGVQGVFIASTGVILLVLGYDVSGTPDAKAYEITMTSLLAGGSWTKMARTWVNGVDQFAGAVDATFWNNQFQAIIGQGSNPGGGLWDTNIGIGTGSASGGTADTTFGASSAVVSTVGGATVNRIIYSTMAVVLANGNLGIAYSFLDFINYIPEYYTRFAVFTDTLFVASCNSPSSGFVSGPYAHTFTSTGGVGAVTWAKTSGSFPTGLTLNPATGVLSGVPGAAATYTFSLTATDSVGNVAAPISCSIVISSGFIASCGSQSGTTVGSTFTQDMSISGGTSPYTWVILSGAIPPGTTLTASTGVITGTLTTAGRYYWTAKVTDASGSFAIVSCFAQACPAGV